MGWPDLSWLSTSEEERAKMQLLRETDSPWETLLLQYSEVSPNIDTIFQSRNLRAKLARAQGQEKTRFETWRKVFYKNFDGGEGDYNGLLTTMVVVIMMWNVNIMSDAVN